MKNQIYYGDNLDVLRRYIKDETVDLCYIDPPFNSKRNYNQIYNNIGKEDTAQAQAFVDTWTWDDNANQGLTEIKINYNGVFTEQSIDLICGLEKVLKKGALFAYLVSMTLRIAEIHRVLKPTGSFYLHCDPTASHYLKLVCDGLFCPRGGDFRNEIVWHYRRWTNSQAQFQRMHDVILFYSKSNKTTFNSLEVEMSDSQRKKFIRGWDSNVIHTAKEKYSQLIVYDKEKYEQAIADNKLKIDKFKNIIFKDAPAVSAPDVIILPTINSQAKERLGYPTQKPEALLERIIKASSNEGDVVLDAYCGCGTTIAVAHRLNRKWIGVDITYQSISLILKRLEEAFTQDFNESVLDKNSAKPFEKIEISGVPKDFESAKALAERQDDKTRKEFEKWMVLSYSKNRAMINDKKGGDKGIDGIAYIADRIENGTVEAAKVIFSVKSDKKLVPAMIDQLNGVIARDGAVCGIFLCLYRADNLVKYSKSLGKYVNSFTGNSYPKIQVICVEDLLNGAVMNLPNQIEVVKKAEQKTAEQKELF